MYLVFCIMFLDHYDQTQMYFRIDDNFLRLGTIFLLCAINLKNYIVCDNDNCDNKFGKLVQLRCRVRYFFTLAKE